MQILLQSRPNTTNNIEKTWLPVNNENNDISNPNCVLDEIRSCSSSTYEENNIEISNEKLDDINDKIFSTTPQRYMLRQTRKLLFDDLEHISNDTKKDEEKVDLGSDADYLSSINSDSNDGSIKLDPQIAKSPIQKKFSILQGQFHIQRIVIFDEYDIINRTEVREEIQHKMIHSLGFPCPLQFYGGARRNTNCLVTYARCRYSSHVQQFKFDITNIDNAIIDIFVSSTKCNEILHEGRPIFCTLKNETREKAKIEMRHMSPRMLQLSVLESVDHELAQDGYLQELRTLRTYQKAKSEENNKNDLHLRSSDLSDLFQQHIIDQQSSDSYIQSTGLPLHVYMYTEEQINILDNTDIIIHFDATGSVVRKPKDITCKRILYYAIVVNKKGTTLPIAEMITAVHNVTAISIFFKDIPKFSTD